MEAGPNNDQADPEEEEEEGEERLSSKTPDLVPKSFQDKRSDSLSRQAISLPFLSGHSSRTWALSK